MSLILISNKEAIFLFWFVYLSVCRIAEQLLGQFKKQNKTKLDVIKKEPSKKKFYIQIQSQMQFTFF